MLMEEKSRRTRSMLRQCYSTDVSDTTLNINTIYYFTLGVNLLKVVLIAP